MSQQIKQCAKCTEPADGLDDEHCQLHWEELCAKGWWKMVMQGDPAETPANTIED